MTEETRPDPIRTARGIADRLLAGATTFVDELVATDGFSETLARGMQVVVNTTSGMRKRANAVGEVASEWLNIPTRQQVVDLARRLNHLEFTLDDVDAKTAEVLRRLEEEAGDD